MSQCLAYRILLVLLLLLLLVKLINHDCLPILMLLYTMLYIVLAYLMLFAALTNSVCLNNASFFFLFKYFLCQGYELSGEIALKNNHYYYYYRILCLYTVNACCMEAERK